MSECSLRYGNNWRVVLFFTDDIVALYQTQQCKELARFITQLECKELRALRLERAVQ